LHVRLPDTRLPARPQNPERTVAFDRRPQLDEPPQREYAVCLVDHEVDRFARDRGHDVRCSIPDQSGKDLVGHADERDAHGARHAKLVDDRARRVNGRVYEKFVRVPGPGCEAVPAGSLALSRVVTHRASEGRGRSSHGAYHDRVSVRRSRSFLVRGTPA